jgi:predicted HTH transcriptional regulator
MYGVRRVDALLLAKRMDEFPELARKAPRVVVYSGINKLETRLDQKGGKGYAVGFQGLIRFIMGQLPQKEVINYALREEFKLVPEVVIRELVANALIHQALSMRGASVMIEIYSNWLEISNPGEPVVPVERFIDVYQSHNERLASLMRLMGICEEKSSGIDRVVQNAEFYQLPAPDFRVANSRTQVVVFWAEGVGRDGPGGSDSCLLSTFGSQMGNVGTHDEPESSGTFSGAGEEERDYLADHLGDH